ncbi:uncharacterized protein LOC144637144 [Oculina patagonica]
MIRDSKLLENRTQWGMVIPMPIFKEANYTCVATSKYGTDKKEVSVLLADCDLQCHYGELGGFDMKLENILYCRNLTSPGDIAKCASKFTSSLKVISSNLSHIPVGVFSKLTGLQELDLSSNAVTFLPDRVFAAQIYLRRLDLSSNGITSLPDRVFSNLTSLGNLDLSSNGITFLPDRVFASLNKMGILLLESNHIRVLSDSVFANQTSLRWLYLSSNGITFLPDGVFSNLRKLWRLKLSSNAITILPDEVFANLTDLNYLNLSSNAIAFLSDRVFAHLTKLRDLDLSSNDIKFVTNRVFANLGFLFLLDLSSNALTFLPDRVFVNLTSLVQLILASNAIKILPERVFANLKLLQLDLSANAITFLPDRVFEDVIIYAYLSLQNNMITSIPNETFQGSIDPIYLFLSGNQLENIPHRAFFNVNPRQEEEHVIMLSDNPITTIEPGAFRWGNYKYGMHVYLLRTKLKILSLESFIGHSVQDFRMVVVNRTVAKVSYVTASAQRTVTIYLNPISSASEAIHVRNPTLFTGKVLLPAVIASGFGRILDISYSKATLLPCPLGTFSNSSTKGADGCTECPPGGFYSDDVGYVSSSCKKCPNGSFVSFDNAPGMQKQDCKSCPEVLNYLQNCSFVGQFSSGDFVSVSQEKSIKVRENDDEQPAVEKDESSCELLGCPNEGCVKMYQRHSSVEKHFLFGHCKMVAEKETLYDIAMKKYHALLADGTSEAVSATPDQGHTFESASPLPEGWTLKTTKEATHFNDAQKSYLEEKFNLGQATGQKQDPNVVARDMRFARKE